jgi:gliding motility-associated-like protein
MKNKILFLVLIANAFIAGRTQAQCTINADAPLDTITCGDAIYLSVFGKGQGQQVFSENFNSGAPSGWAFTQQATFTNPCSPNGVDGTKHIWMGDQSGAPRELKTVPYNFSTATAGVTICFDMLFAAQGGNSPCEGPDEPQEGVYLQYSTNGTTWTTIKYFDPNGGTDPQLTNWNNWCFQLPQAALVNGVSIRWYQDNVTAAVNDHWGIDNVNIYQNDPTYTITVTEPGGNNVYSFPQGSSGGQLPSVVKPKVTTSYYFSMTNTTGTTCKDTLTIAVRAPKFAVNAGNDTTVCTGKCANINATAKVIKSPAKNPTFKNIQPDTVAASSFGGIISQGAIVNINVRGLNMQNVQNNSITSVCIDKIKLGNGIGLDANSLELYLLCPDGTSIKLMPISQATGAGSLFSYTTVFDNTCFVPAGPAVGTGTPPYTGSFGTDQSFNGLTGCTANGIWQLSVVPKGTFSSGNIIITGWSISFDDPEISYTGNFNWSPTTEMTSGSTTLSPTVCPTVNHSYVLTVSDTANCATVRDTVNVNTKVCCNFKINAAVTQPSCGNSNGAINITINPSGNYTYAWNNSSVTTAGRTGLAPGTYTVTIFDAANNCSSDTTITLVNTNTLSLTATNPVSPSCGANDGSATISLSGGLAPYVVVIDTGSANVTINVPFAISQTINTFPAGTIVAYVTDATGCKDTATIIIAAPNCCNITVVKDSLNPACGASTGWADVDVTPAGNYTYAWSSPVTSTTDSAFGLSAGSYAVTITQMGGGNAITDTIFRDNLNAGAGNWTLNGGTGGNQWVVNNTYAGGTCTIIFFPGGTIAATPNQPAQITGSPQSSYLHIKATTNPDGCNAPWPPANANFDGDEASTQYATLTNPISTTGYTNVTIKFYWLGSGGANASGSIQYSANGGPWTTIGTTLSGSSAWAQASVNNAALDNQAALKFRFVWTNTIAGGSNPALSIDQIEVTGEKPNNGPACQSTVRFNLASPNAPVIGSLTSTAEVCSGNNNGTATVAATGGTGNLSYAWSSTSQTTASVTNLTPGSYTVTVTDGAGCSVTGTVVVAAGPACCTINLSSAVTQPTCGSLNGAINLTVTPVATYTYAWSDAPVTTANRTGLSSGTYTVTITNPAVANCTKDTTFVLNSSSTLDLVLSNPVNPGCGQANGSITAALSGGTAPYVVTINDGTSTQTLNVPFAITQTLNNLPAGNYTIVVTDAISCQVTKTQVLTAPAAPVISNITSTAEVCLGDGSGTATVTAAGGTGVLSYSWNTTPAQSNPTATALPAGTYSVTVTDANSCADTGTVTVAAGPVCCNIVIAATLTQPSCGLADGAVQTTVTGAQGAPAYAWSVPGTGSGIANVAAGSYSLTVTDAVCSKDTTFNLSNANAAIIDSINTTNETCLGDASGSATIYISGGQTPYTITWSNGLPQNNTTQTNLAAGGYTITVTDVVNCITIGNFNISAGPLCCTLAASGATTPVSCAGNDGSIKVSVTTAGTAPYEYKLGNAAFQSDSSFDSLSVGSYTIEVRDANNCRDTVTVSVISTVNDIVLTVTGTDVTCFGAADGAVLATFSGGLAPVGLEWNTGAQTAAVTNLGPGTYSVTVTDQRHCSALGSVTVIEPVLLAVSLPADTAICEGSTLILDAGTASSYSWSTGAITQTITVDTTNTYYVTVTNATGCSATDDVLVTVVPTPQLSILPADTSIFQNNDVQLTTVVVGNAAGQYVWTPAKGLSCADCPDPIASPSDSTEYKVSYTDPTGCKTEAYVTIYVDSFTAVFMPNVFSPNGDGFNDFLAPLGKGIKSYSWSVYNRWGEKVYDGSGTAASWDGTFQGTMQPVGTYVYTISVTFQNNKTKMLTGSLTLIR